MLKNLSLRKSLISILVKIFPFLIVITYFFLGIEIFTYLGFLRKVLAIDSRLLFGLWLSIGFAFLNLRLFDDEIGRKGLSWLVLNINILLLPVLALSFYILQALETTHYPNYVYSTLHIQLNVFNDLLFFSVFLGLLKLISYLRTSTSFFEKYFVTRSGVNFQTKTIVFIGALIGIYFVVINLEKSFVMFLDSLVWVRPMVGKDKEEKYRLYEGNLLYYYWNFVRENTPPSARILIPPQNYPWPKTGNALYSRYYLNPRFLINGGDKDLGSDIDINNIDFILIVWGETQSQNNLFSGGWPKFDVPAKRVFYVEGLESGNVKVKTINEDYRYQNTPGLWGLIEVDKNRKL